MKSHRFALRLYVVLLISSASVLSAVETVRLDLVLHVFKDADVGSIVVGGAPAAVGQAIVFNGSSSVAFDQKTLTLKGAEYTWNGGPPACFSILSTPAIVTTLGKTTSILIAQPVQYLEKAEGNNLQIREIPSDSPDLPHYQITFDVHRAVAPSTDLLVSCQMDIAMLQGREKIPGVELEVGRPILTWFKDNVEFRNSVVGWSGLMLRRPGGSDYSLLMLLKVSPADTSGIRPVQVVTPPK